MAGEHPTVIPRLAIALCAVLACKDERTPERAPAPPPAPAPAPAPAQAAPDADDMDEKMRHCPLAIDGVTATLSDIDGGVQFEIRAGAAGAAAEVRRRARHIVEFAAGRHVPGTHGGGRGGGTMRNCPVVTSDVTLVAEELPDGARIRVTVPAARIAELRAESRERAGKFPYAGAKVIVAP
jgi:hypothetical protein